MNAIFPIHTPPSYKHTHPPHQFLFRSKLPTILNEWPYSRRACTSSSNAIYRPWFHGTIVNCYDSMPSLFHPSSTPSPSTAGPTQKACPRGTEGGERVGIGFACFIWVECQQRSVRVRFVDSSTNSGRYRARGSAEHRILRSTISPSTPVHEINPTDPLIAVCA